MVLFQDGCLYHIVNPADARQSADVDVFFWAGPGDGLLRDRGVL